MASSVLERGRSGVVAVVDADKDDVWIWWVNVGERPQKDMSRLCGAWELDASQDGFADTLESLVFMRMVLATRDGKKALKKARVSPGRELDVYATVAAVLEARAECQQVFDVEQAKRSKSTLMKEPTWPSFPDPLDVENPPPWDVNHASMDHLDPCLSIGHWLAALCSRWEDLEEERLARPLLRKLGPLRTLPVVTITAA
jgi:hypothetical protein